MQFVYPSQRRAVSELMTYVAVSHVVFRFITGSILHFTNNSSSFCSHVVCFTACPMQKLTITLEIYEKLTENITPCNGSFTQGANCYVMVHYRMGQAVKCIYWL